ncbi:MAG TPA: gliding motility lipoprotein GldH [Cyclobacteriaceae bacterium]
MEKLIALLVTLFALAMSSCDDGKVYQEYHDLENNIWKKDYTPKFEFDINDISLNYNIFYSIRNGLDYPFYNLYLKYTLTDPRGQEISSEMHEVILFDPKTGKPRGSGLGDTFNHRILCLENQNFKKEGAYNIKIQQYMRRDSLPEIKSVGIRIEESR